MSFSFARLMPVLPRRAASSLPDDDLPPTAEARLPLHVLARDAHLSIEDGQLLVEAGETRQLLRLDELSQVVLHGGAGVTVPSLHALIRAGVPVVMLSHNGYYLGQTLDLSGASAAVRRAQYRAAENTEQSLAIARDLIGAKLRATARLARRRAGARTDIVRSLDRARRDVARVRNVAKLRGIEGSAAAAWYNAWEGFLTRDDPALVFDGRSRRPPRDSVNALLSYLYAVTTGLAASAASAAGLDPTVGVYHTERPGRPALALDLVEPFRVAVVDAAVLAGLNEGVFSAGDFTMEGEGGVRLTDQGRRRALGLLEQRLSIRFRDGETETTWRDAITRSATRLATGLRSGHARLAVPMPAG